MTNEAKGNVVLASTIGTNGALTSVRAFPTGGNGATGIGGGPDALFSQGSVKVGGSNLFVVNVRLLSLR